MSSSSLSEKKKLFVMLQFLYEEKLIQSAHSLEQETGIYFNLKYFEEKVLDGGWDEAENYLSGFTNVHDNTHSMMICFEIKKQKYLEALDRDDQVTAVEILVNEMKLFSEFFMYKELTTLLALKNFRENDKFSKYGDTMASRTVMMIELKKLFEANPVFHQKLSFPTLETSKLKTLIRSTKAEPKTEPKAEPKTEPKVEPKAEPKTEP